MEDKLDNSSHPIDKHRPHVCHEACAHQAVHAYSHGVKTLLLPALLAVAVVAYAHWPVLNAHAINLDDQRYLFDNPVLMNPSWASARVVLCEVLQSSTIEGYYEPLTLLSLMLDVALGGTQDNLRVFHVTNIVLHLLNTFSIIILIYMLFDRPWIAAAIGLIFGVHPLTVEPVAWVWERKTLLSALFAVWCIILYVRHVRRPSLAGYVGLSIMFVLALMAKPTVTPLPALLLLMDFWPLRRLSVRAVVEKIPLFAIAAVSSYITVVSTARNAAAALLGDYSLVQVPLKICYLIAFYLGKIIWPRNLSSIYVLPQPLALSHPMIILGVVCTGVLIVLLAVSLRWTRAAVMAGMFFVVAMSPTLGVVQYSWVAASDKYVYIPAIGLLIALAALVDWAVGNSTRIRPAWCRVATGMVVVVAGGVLIANTRGYLRQWRSTKQFTYYMLNLAPNSPFAQACYGNALSDEGDYNGAIVHLNRAIELQPADDEAYNNRGHAYYRLGDLALAIQDYTRAIERKPTYAVAYSNRGNAYFDMGDHVRAIQDCTKAIELKPNLAEAYNNRGNVYREIGDRKQAVQDYSRAIELKPRLAEARNNRGTALRELGEVEQAIQDSTRAIELRPDFAEAYAGRGAAYADKGDYQRAIADYSKAIELKPDHATAYNNRGIAYANLGDRSRAIADYSKAIQLNPDSENAYNNRGAAYCAIGDFAAAIKDYSKAIELKPNLAMAYNNLANAYLGMGDFQRAIGEYAKAVELDPNYIDAYYNRGMAYRDSGQYAEAILDYTRVLELKPNEVEALANRAIAHFLLKQYDQAWADVKKCRQLGSDLSPEFLRDLAQTSGRTE